MKRRTFLKRAVGSAAALSMWRNTALIAQNTIGANDRINIGLIGCGGRGMLVGRLMNQAPNVAYIGFCDVSDDTVNAAKTSNLAGANAQAYKDFRRVLDNKDIQVIHVATPDHWHAIPTVLGCQAGKDVYVEKPLALTIWEGREMVKAARKYNRIVQCGMQHRSAPHYKEVEDIIQSGGIGDVHFVRVTNYGASAGGEGFPDADVPAGVDWDMYLGPRPKVPYNRQRFQGTFRRFFDYSGGFITDYGAHRLDSVAQIMHDDRPLSVCANGQLYMKYGQADTPDIIQVSYEYKNWRMSYEGVQLNTFGTGPRIWQGRTPYSGTPGGFDRPHGEAFYGTRGTIFSDRVGYELFPAGGGGRGRGGGGRRGAGGAAAGGAEVAAVPTIPEGVKSVQGGDRTDLHTLNFIECVRSRKAPNAEVEIGHKSTLVCHLGNISYKIGGEKIKWDPDKEQFDNAKANALIHLESRKPWDLI